MIRVLVVAGTADAAELIKLAPLSWQITATTISELGAKSLVRKGSLDIRTGALDKEGFTSLIKEADPNFILDMSHPFATEVTANIKDAAARTGVPYLRYLRPSEELEGKVVTYPDFPKAVDGLKALKGNILLTIGSRNLHYFQKLPDFKERFYLRVLADSKILAQLEAMEIDPSHVFAMKGVASKDLNIALAKEVAAQAIVTKDSGIKGGIREKAAAAAALNIPLIVIAKPPEDGTTFTTIEEIINHIEGRN